MSSMEDFLSPSTPSQNGQTSNGGPQTPRNTKASSTVDTQSLTEIQQYASLWAADTRGRLDKGLRGEAGFEIMEEDVFELMRMMREVFIATLQNQSLAHWQFLQDILDLSVPYTHLIENRQEILHYVDRIYYHAQQKAKYLSNLDVMESLSRVFPKYIQLLTTSGGDKRNFRTPTPPSVTLPSSDDNPYDPMLLPNGRHPYTLERPGEEAPFKPKGLCFSDLREALPAVVLETTKREAVWSEGLGLTAAALNLDLQEKASSESMLNKSSVSQETAPSWTADSALFKEDYAVSEEEEPLPSALPMTGKEAVELFGKGRHLGKAKFVYLNKAPNRHFRPYDLIAVPKHKADPNEHWIVSCFGIMHKVKGQTSDSMPLYDWHREAVIWSTLTKMPFFKHFLIRKTFKRWLANKKLQEFCAVRHHIKKNLLQAVPLFGAGLLQVSKLLQELSTVRFLPLDQDRCFTLAEFEHTAKMKQRTGEGILDKFFSYCKLIMERTCEDSFNKLQFCEAQAKKDKALFSKESLFIQRQKKEQREKNLKKAQEETRCLGNFVQLVDKILLCHLLSLARTNICQFVNNTMAAGSNAKREALFAARLIFNDNNTLILYPSRETFTDSLSAILHEIPALISNMSHPMESVASGWVGGEKEPPQTALSPRAKSIQERSQRAESNPALSVTQKSTTTRKSAVTIKSKVTTRTDATSEVDLPPLDDDSSSLGSDSHDGASDYGSMDETDFNAEETNTEGGTTLSAPVLSDRVERTKSSDQLGVATPDLVLKTGFQVDLQVKGQGMMGQYSPLNQNNLINTLENDIEVLAAMANYQSLLELAIQDINDFCNENLWLSEIREFILSWKPESVQAWKRAQAYTIETKLGQIRDWTEKVRNVDRSFPTSNGLFQVDCSAIQEDLVPALNSAFKDLLNFAASEGQKFSLAFISEVKMVVEGMRNKDTDIAVFANYAQQYSTYKVKMPELQKEVEYVKSLFEVIRLSYRSLSTDEEKCEEKVWQSWEAFLLQLQDAAEFVNTQTPIQMSYLEHSHEKLNAEALRISTTATSGDYLDPSKNPTRLLPTLKALIEEFLKVQTRMIQCSHYREKIMGQTFETSQLTSMLSHMKIRLTLWSYLDVSTYNIKDWKQQLFRKMNVTKALDKVTEWQQAAGQLKQQLPLGDKVLSYWYRFLSDFKQDLPLLKKLSSNSLKPRHWKALFLSLGQVYEPAHAYTVQELLSFDLSEHSLQINTICNGAAAEFALEQSLIKLRRLWEDKEFKLAKHIPVVKEKKATLPSSSSKTKRGHKGNSREAATRPTAASMPLITTLPDMFILIGEAELKYMLEDNLVTLQCMLVSPHLADLRTEAEVWCSTLKQVEEILDLWTACQTKWLYLGRVFGDQELREEFQDLASKFDDADLKYQDIMKAVVTDPKVMSVLEKRKGQKGYRELQGDVLRELLTSLISTQEEILKDLKCLLNKIRMTCPRLYFLSDEELIDMLCMTRDKRRWVPLVRQIFPGIQNLQFALPPASKEETEMMQTSFDLQLHANRLRVVAIEGNLGEHVPMATPLNPKVEPPQWISGLETIMRNSLGSQLTACLEIRLGSDRSAPDKILAELAHLEATAPSSDKEKSQLKDAVKQSYQHWLLRFPTQCVIITEAIMWAKDIRRGLKDGCKDKLKRISDQHQTRLDQYVSILRDNCSRYLSSETRTRLQILLGSLINQGLHHRDILNRLLSLPEPSLSSFDWVKILHYSMETRLMLQAQPVTSDVDQEQDPANVLDLPPTPRPYQYTSTTGRIFGPCTLHQLGASFAYNYEYQGPDTPMVATPLTDRCQLAMTTALRSFQCGTVMGPEQLGKAQTIRDLAKVMGRHLVTFNCAEATNMSVLTRLLSGMVQSGSWVMFTNLNCMTEGLMSVFGQQLNYLCTALRILQSPFSNQYSTRGFSHHHHHRQRRNSLTTLHSSCPEEHSEPPRRRVSHHHRKEPKPPASYLVQEVKVKPEPHTIQSMPQRRHSISNGSEVHLKDHYIQPCQPVPLLPDLYGHGVPSGVLPQPKDTASLPTPWIYKPTVLGHVMLNNTLMPASSNFGCFATLNTSSSITHEIPDTLRSLMRPMSMVKPDLRIILQSALYWRGFIGADALASKLCTFADLFQTQFPESQECTFGLRTIQSVIKIATIKLYAKKQVFQLPGRSATRNSSILNSETGSESNLMDSDVPSLEQDEEHREEIAVVFAIQSILLPSLHLPDHARIVRNLLRSVFPWGGMGRPGTTSQEHDPVLVDSIQCQFVADKLQATPQHVTKVLELYDSLKEKQGVILVGPAGSGKTVCWETLSRVLNTLHTTPPTKEDGRTSPAKKISITSSTDVELRRSHTVEKIRRTAGALGKISLSWISAATQGVEDVVYPEVDTDVIFPDALSVQELLGNYEESSHSWRDGIFTRLLRDTSISASAAKVLLSEQTEKKNKALLNPPSIIQRWLILDGYLNPEWTESVGMLLKTDCKMMNLDQGEQIPMADSCSILFETSDLSMASPALISRCGIVHCGGEVVYWKSLTESWLSSAKSHWEVPNISDTNVNRSYEPWLCNKSHWNINKNCLQMLTALIEDTFSSTIDFLNRKCQPILSADLPASISSNYRIVDGIQEVSSFLRILSALCDKFLVHEEEGSDTDSPVTDGRPTPSPITNRPETAGNSDLLGQANPTTRFLSMFAFSFIWGFGGHLHSRYVDAFSCFARETLSRASFDINLPLEGSVYDYKIDPYHGVLVPWGDRSQDRAKTLPSGYTIIPEIERYFGLIDLLLSSNCPVLLTGPSGVGKSALIQNMVQPKHYFLKTNMSPGLSCQSFEDAIVSKLRPRSVAMAAVATGGHQQKSSSSQLFFIDDLNCASVDSKTGSLPCTDVLRQLLVHSGVYDRKRLFFKSLEGANFITACTPPGVSGVGSGTASYPLSPRLTRLFCVLSLFPLGRDEMDDLHRPNLQGWLEEFPAYSLAHHYELAQALLSATLDLHAVIQSKLSPTPITPHYVFSLHDINRVIQGLYLLSPHSRGRPRHGARRGGGGRPQAAGGRGRRGRVKGADGQGVVTAPPMMRTVVRLWCHEATRTYCDRIGSKEDELWFSKQLEDIVEKCFCTGEEKQRVVTPVNNPDAFQFFDSPGSSSPLFISSSPAFSSLPSTPCSFTPSLASDEGGEPGQTPPTNGVFSGLSSAERGSTAMTEDGDELSEIGVASPTPSSHSSAGTTLTEQSILMESVKQPTVNDESKLRLPTPPTITTHQPTPPRKSSVPKTLTPALKDGLTKRGREGETRLAAEGRRRGVTFQLGTVNESKVDRYNGPLLSMDQVRLLGENLSDIVFAKYIVSGNKEAERGYVECNETQLFEGLQRCLMQYNNGASEKMELVFFKEAMRHIARLARVFAIPGANALLIGLTYGMARSPLARVAAFTARCKFFDATASHIAANNRTILREKIRKASQVAGLMGKPTVLVVRGEYEDQALQDVCAVMSEGSCPDLYTQEELDNISSQMLPGAKVTGHRNQRLEMALERFYRKVMLNLHVVICIDCQGGSLSSLHKWLNRYPAMLTNCCCVDIYRPWSHEALVNVAEQWLRVPTMDTYTRKTYRIPWSRHDMSSQVTSISHAMAYVHRSAMEAVSKAGNKHFKFFSPLTYLEFIDLFKNLASKIAKEEKATVLKYERALDTLNEAFEAMNGYSHELERLTPLRQQAQETAELRLQEVEECKAIFAEARGMCNQDEEDIAKMQEPLQDIKKQTQDELDKVNPVYEAAWHALKSLNSSDLDEIRTYQKPPEAVIKVVNALCLMFREPYDWMSGKALINRNNFFQDLEFYNKMAIPDDIYHKLNILFIQDPSFKPEIVKKASKAASSLCLWVHAVYAYATIHRNMRPKLQQVEEAEGKLHEAQGHLGNKRVKAQDVKGQLEDKVKQYKEAMRMVRSLDKGIRTIEGKISRANTLMTSMATQHSTWKGQLDTANSNIKTAPGDALLAAASACYQGPLGQAGRKKLLADWLARCQSGKFVDVEGLSGQVLSLSPENGMGESPLQRSSRQPGQSPVRDDNQFTNLDMTSGLDTSFDASSGSLSSDVLFAPANSRLSRVTQDTDQPAPTYPITVRDNFTAEAILSTPEEQASWKSNNTIPHDRLAFHNALFMRTCCIGRQRQWPLLIDPDDQVMTWVKLLHERGVISFHDGLAFEEGNETPAALSIANVNELNEFEDSLSRETPTTKPTSRGTSTDEWENATDYPGTPRTVTSFGGDTQYTLKNSFNFRDLDGEDDLSISNTFQDDSFLLETLPDDSDILKPAENLWIIPADNPSLEIRLIQGMLLGATIVVTHIERKALDQRFSELLKRNVMIGEEGERRVMIGGREFGYHPSFCLYLCTSVPLELTDSGFVPVLIETTSVIDLSISPEGLTAQLLQHIMAVERREYEGQWRSIEGDIHNQEAMLQQAEEEILHKTLNLPHSLLEESTMADALSHHQQVTLTTEASLHETHTLAEQLLQRQAPYNAVAQHGTLLYLVIKSMPILHPLYYIPMCTFIQWFKTTIGAHKKNRADIGSPEARAVELTNAIMLDTHSKVSLAMFQVHSQLFSFLVAVEKMKAANELTEEEWLCFVGGASEATGTNQMMPDRVSVPDWITPLMWIGCSHLEEEFQIFRGLKESLVKFSNQWREYFQHDPVLLAPVPGASLAHLSFMQKALLWRIMRPDKLSNVCRDLTIYQLGSQVSSATPYSMETVLTRCDNHTPVIFILPAAYTDDGSINGGCEGHPFMHPITSVTQYLQQQGKEAYLHTISMGTDDQLSRALHAMEECSVTGHWLIIDNVHLLEDLKAKDMLQFIQKMVLANKQVRPSESRPQTKQSSKNSRQSSREESESQAVPDPEGEIHEDFRLFLITRADSPNRIPGLLLQYGVKVSCEETVNFKESLRHSFNDGMKAMESSNHLVSSATAKMTNEMVFCISLLHTVLSQRRRFTRIGFSQDYYWSHNELLTSLDMLRTLQPLDIYSGLNNLQDVLGSVVYGGCVLDREDLKVVQAIVDSLIVNWQDVQQMPSSMGVSSLLASLQPVSQSQGRRSRVSSGYTRRLQRVFDTMKDEVQPTQLGLMSGTPRLMETREGRYLSTALQKLEKGFTVNAVSPMQRTVALLHSVQHRLDAIQPFGQPSSESLSYLETFLSSEITILNQTIKSIQSDVSLLLQSAQGSISLPPLVEDALLAISQDTIPQSWLPSGHPECTGVLAWIERLKARGELLERYITEGDRVVGFDLAVFSNPKMFLKSVLQEHARKEYIEVPRLQMETHVMDLPGPPTMPPDIGVYINGLLLHNAEWDLTRRLMTLPHIPDPSQMITDDPSPLPITWFKPVVDSILSQDKQQSCYRCPMYMQGSKVTTLSSNDLLTYVDLPSKIEASIWAQKKVFITPP